MQKALNYALKILSKKDYSEKQIEDKLKHKEVSNQEIADIILFLKDKKFVDGLRYAKNYIKLHISRGEIRLKFELAQKGILEETISEAMSILGDGEASSRAREVAIKWLDKNKQKYVNRNDLKNKLFSKLSRQGFLYQTMKEVWEDLKN